METGVCYFPEHWSRDQWETDATEMGDVDLTARIETKTSGMDVDDDQYVQALP